MQHRSNSPEILKRSIGRQIFPEEDLYFGAQSELPAYIAQVNAKGLWQLGDREVMRLSRIAYLLEKIMKEEAKKLGRDWRRDLSKILCPSPFDDPVREKYSLD